MPVEIRIWLTIFVCWPAPAPPRWTIERPITSNSGITARIASASPPTMIERVALRAPTSPPETGASIACTSRSRARSKISTASDGSVVVMSTIVDPGAAPARTPWSPRMTARTSSGNPTMLNVTSLAAATSAEVSDQTAPRSRSGSARSRVRVWTVTA